MSSNIGKIGIGMAGAIACAGLLSAGVPSANAELFISSLSVTQNNANYDWTYTLANETTSFGSGSYFMLGLPVNAAIVGGPTTNLSSSWTLATTIMPFTRSTLGSFSFTYSGSNSSQSAIGTFTIVSTTNLAALAGNPGIGLIPGTITYAHSPTNYVYTLPNAVYNPGSPTPALGTDFVSVSYNSTGSADYYLPQSIYVPSENGFALPNAIASGGGDPSPTPIPGSFGLVGIGSLVLIGGMTLRRRMAAKL